MHGYWSLASAVRCSRAQAQATPQSHGNHGYRRKHGPKSRHSHLLSSRMKWHSAEYLLYRKWKQKWMLVMDVVKVQLYCVCKQPYKENQFMIQCDTCKDWFHGRWCFSIVSCLLSTASLFCGFVYRTELSCHQFRDRNITLVLLLL